MSQAKTGADVAAQTKRVGAGVAGS